MNLILSQIITEKNAHKNKCGFTKSHCHFKNSCKLHYYKAEGDTLCR